MLWSPIVASKSSQRSSASLRCDNQPAHSEPALAFALHGCLGRPSKGTPQWHNVSVAQRTLLLNTLTSLHHRLAPQTCLLASRRLGQSSRFSALLHTGREPPEQQQAARQEGQRQRQAGGPL